MQDKNTGRELKLFEIHFFLVSEHPEESLDTHSFIWSFINEPVKEPKNEKKKTKVRLNLFTLFFNIII